MVVMGGSITAMIPPAHQSLSCDDAISALPHAGTRTRSAPITTSDRKCRGMLTAPERERNRRGLSGEFRARLSRGIAEAPPSSTRTKGDAGAWGHSGRYARVMRWSEVRPRLQPRSGVGVIGPWLVIAPPGSPIIRVDLRVLDQV